MVEKGSSSFNKRSPYFLLLANELLAPAHPFTKPLDFLQGEPEHEFAIYFQNSLHPKNSQRRDAIAQKKYVELLTVGDSSILLTQQLQSILKGKLQVLLKELNDMAQEKLSKRGLQLFVMAPDRDYAAAVLSMNSFTLKDRDELLRTLMQLSEEQCPALAGKMALLNKDRHQGFRLFKELFGTEQEKAAHFKKAHFKVWQELVVKRPQLTKDDFKEIFPEATHKADLWADCLDETGAPRRKLDKFWTYVNEKKAKKKQEMNKREAKAATKKKF